MSGFESDRHTLVLQYQLTVSISSPGPCELFFNQVFGHRSYSLSYPEGELRKIQGVLTILQGAPLALGLRRAPGPRGGGGVVAFGQSTDKWEGPGCGHRCRACVWWWRAWEFSFSGSLETAESGAGGTVRVSGRDGRYFRGVCGDFGILLICYVKKTGHNESYCLVNMCILILYNRRNARIKTLRVIISKWWVYK